MANLLPLVLSAKTKNWRESDLAAAEADAEFQQVRKKAIERDQCTCRFCGFQSRKLGYYMQVHHRDDDHHNNRLDNLVTACMHCHAVQHIGLWGSAKEAVLVYLPEMDQATLNHLCRHVLVARRWNQKLQTDDKVAADRKSSARDIADTMEALFAKIRAREADAAKILCTSDPAELANVFLTSAAQLGPVQNEAFYAKRHRTLANFRLLLLGPHRPQDKAADIMPDIVDGWLQPGGPYVGLQPSTWANLLKQVSPR